MMQQGETYDDMLKTSEENLKRLEQSFQALVDKLENSAPIEAMQRDKSNTLTKKQREHQKKKLKRKMKKQHDKVANMLEIPRLHDEVMNWGQDMMEILKRGPTDDERDMIMKSEMELRQSAIKLLGPHFPESVQKLKLKLKPYHGKECGIATDNRGIAT